MNSTISLEKPETIVIELKGKPDPADMECIFQKVNEYIKAGLEKARVLVDNSELENIPPKTRKAIKEQGSKFSGWKKLAIYGARPAVKVLGNLILRLIPQSGPIKFFDTEKKARAWLEENKEEA
jgi:hypothetical protein